MANKAFETVKGHSEIGFAKTKLPENLFKELKMEFENMKFETREDEILITVNVEIAKICRIIVR